MKIKYIFFDFDGVLAESVNIKTEAFRQLYLSYGDEFAQRVVDYHQANGGVSRFEKIKVFNGEWLGEALTEEKIQSLADKFSDLVMDGVINAPEVTGASDFLNSANEYEKYIITGTPTLEIIPILKQRKMFHFFKGVYGSPENKDFWVKEILTTKNISPNQCVFIGDALSDYKAALCNDITFILRETEEGKELFKDFTGIRVEDLSNLHPIIEKLNV
ncbi:HAD-IA family hydrolase [Flavobacterium sp.]|uniref:HAD family hydrolase n=1 Tax=Flavobacterium sp. TaxID=239 RepID=UPI00286E6DFC|nr:HAD-IA family hydrolase [Flavobacterium sp.]